MLSIDLYTMMKCTGDYSYCVLTTIIMLMWNKNIFNVCDILIMSYQIICSFLKVHVDIASTKFVTG